MYEERGGHPARPVGVLFVGMRGAVATTVVAGVFAARSRLVSPIGLVTEDAHWAPLAFVPLDGMVFGGWDLRPGDLHSAALADGIVPGGILGGIASELQAIESWRGVVVKRDRTIDALMGPDGGQLFASQAEAVRRVRSDIARFRTQHALQSVVVVNTASTEAPVDICDPIFADLDAFEAALEANAPQLPVAMVYAYAALTSGCPVINFTPSTIEAPALLDLAEGRGIPLAGKDGKTGQTLVKTVIAPMLRMRRLQVPSWYSVNLLGNRDGFVLADPEHLASKIDTKAGVLRSLLGPDVRHEVRIEFWPDAGDAKEAWDRIVFEGWLGTRMSMRIDWQGQDSILAAPLIVDLVRLVDLAHRQGRGGVLTHCASFFKAPYGVAEHNLFLQYQSLLRYLEESLQGVDEPTVMPVGAGGHDAGASQAS